MWSLLRDCPSFFTEYATIFMALAAFFPADVNS